ncbi:MAG: Holliday junction resolvase RuvX [Acidobacteriota bacterium]
MRVLGIDFGRRRVGLAISDPSGTLARPLATVETSPARMLEDVSVEIARLIEDDDGLAEIVVGVPVALDGSPTRMTAEVRGFVRALRARWAVPILGVEERLTSREAESRLAVGERDWKKRKAKLDAAAAAVILQDHLDRLHASTAGLEHEPEGTP